MENENSNENSQVYWAVVNPQGFIVNKIVATKAWVDEYYQPSIKESGLIAIQVKEEDYLVVGSRNGVKLLEQQRQQSQDKPTKKKK